MTPPERIYLSREKLDRMVQDGYTVEEFLVCIVNEYPDTTIEYLSPLAVEKMMRGLVDIEEFCRWLEKEGYLDSDWWAEPPTVLERWSAFLASKNTEGK